MVLVSLLPQSSHVALCFDHVNIMIGQTSSIEESLLL